MRVSQVLINALDTAQIYLWAAHKIKPYFTTFPKSQTPFALGRILEKLL